MSHMSDESSMTKICQRVFKSVFSGPPVNQEKAHNNNRYSERKDFNQPRIQKRHNTVYLEFKVYIGQFSSHAHSEKNLRSVYSNK